MRSALRLLVVALPLATSFTVRPAAYPAVVASPAAAAPASSCQKRHRFAISGDRRSRSGSGSRTRRRMVEGKGANMDSSEDDDEDAEIYASLRRRLEELEKSAPIADQVEAARSPETPPRAREREREFTIPRESDEDKKRSRALLTIQSVGVISAALSFGTLALYWLAGAYFVHLGPREYPGSVSARGGSTAAPGIERTAGEGEDGGAPGASQAPPRRAMGGSATREAFRFEGFPDAAGKDAAVAPDF